MPNPDTEILNLIRQVRTITIKRGCKVISSEDLAVIGEKVVINKIARAEGKPEPFPILDGSPIPEKKRISIPKIKGR